MKRNFLVIFYYIILLLLFASWQSIDVVPGAAIRIAYFAAVLLPTFFVVKDWFVMVIATFTSLALFGYTSSYMPVMAYSYLAVTAFFVFFYRGNRYPFGGFLIPLMIFALFHITFINAFEGELYPISTTMLLSILLLLLYKRNSGNTLQFFSYAFIAVSIVMSIQFLTMGKDMISVYSNELGIDRQGYKDINYSACVVGMGVISSIVELFSRKNTNTMKIVLIVAILLSLFTMIMNASRGSLLGVAAGTVIILFASHVKTSYKVLCIIGICAFVFYLYNNDYMELVLYRIQNDDGTGSERSVIWMSKYHAFISKGDVQTLLLGNGLQGARDLGMKGSTHNDFLSFLFSYGILGFCMFMYLFFIYPIRCKSANKTIIIAALAYLFVCCFTLEPLAKGYHAYYYFWLYIIMMTLPQQGMNELPGVRT